MTFQIKNIKVGQNFPARVVAEISSNHNGSYKRMIRLINSAKLSKVDFIKLQTYTADTMTINSNRNEFLIKNSKFYNGTLYKLYEKAFTPWHWHNDIKKLCDKLKIICFSTPFDISAVNFLEKLNFPAFKISSFELTDLPLIKEVAMTNKPTIISTGLATKKEISESVNCYKKYSKSNFMLLKCTSSYPAEYKDLNLTTLKDMRNYFGCEVGFSDHTPDNIAALYAASNGATLIEKHFNIIDNKITPDSHFSAGRNTFTKLADDLKKIHQLKGKIFYGPTKSEKSNLKSRRSIYYIKNIKAKQRINETMIKIIRPAKGLEPKYYDKILGKTLKRNVYAGTPVNLKHFK